MANHMDATIQDNQGTNGLKRSLRIWDLVIFGLIFMNPVAAMAMFGIITKVSNGHSVMAYVIGFVAMLFTAYSFGKMVRAFPVAGSTYTYAKRALHPRFGFMAGWGILLDYLFLPMLTYLISASYAHELVPGIPIWAWVLIFAIPVKVINILGIEIAAKVNFGLAILLIVVVITFVVSAIQYITTGSLQLVDMNVLYNPDTFSFSALISGSAIVIVAYLGFDAITTLAEETRESGKKIGTALFITCIIQTIFFVTITYLGMVVIGHYTAIDNPDTAFYAILETVSHPFVQTFIAVMIIVSNVAAGLASQISASRMLYGMGRDNVIPNKFFGYIHPKFKTPVHNLLLMSAMAIAGALLVSLPILSDLISFGGLFGFACVNLSVISHYYIRNKERNIFKHLIVPFIGIVVCLYILFGLSTIGKIVGVSWMALGIIYLIVRALLSKDPKVHLTNNIDQNSN
ncbi:hypothetical protein A8709_23165 [Paenibacillus pectinilyticus]|uniref:Amino acid permease/ SLC12A domain-containing protein n=1 Tax=Paenibacillus pectinilyticus TaxID=512399 RepID=A0A1C0ZRQ2_9BACL|nr:amino acid permease [Paenibacillus pectinilyticus]OCT10738.1 hypothetical protein A8709_23165 [Paenibacillus pectinilyticus]